MIKKIIIILLLALTLAAVAGLIYLSNYYLPAKLNAYLVNTLESACGYNAQVGDIRYHLLKGMVIKDILIYDKTKTLENTILTVKEISFNFFLLPLLRQQKAIIPIIHVRSPHLNIRYSQDGSLNFVKSLSRLGKTERAEKTRFSLLIYKINISSAECLFKDLRYPPGFIKQILNLNMGLALSPAAKATFLIQADIPIKEKDYARIFLKGEYNFRLKELNAQAQLTGMPIEEFLPYLTHLPFSIEAGKVENAKIDLGLKGNLLAIQGAISTSGVEIKKDDLILNSDITVEPYFEYDFDKKESNYTFNFGLSHAKLSGIKYIEKITNANGYLKLDKESVSSEGIRLKTLNSDFNLRGKINFKTADISLIFSSPKADLSAIFALLRQPQDLALEGNSAVSADVEGNLRNIPLNKKAVFNINGALFKAPFLKEPVQNIYAKIILTEEGADWDELSLQYLGLPYLSSGKMRDFKAPRLDFSLNNKDLELKSKVKIDGKNIWIDNAQGRYIGTSFDFSADVDIQNSDNPFLDIDGTLKIGMPESLAILPVKISERLKKFKPSGILDVRAAFIGKAKNYLGWEINAKTTSQEFSVYGLKFKRLSFDLEQRNGAIQVLNLNSSLYSGSANASFRADLNPQSMVYTAYFNAKDVDLAELKSDVGLKDKDISGYMGMDANLKGELTNLESMKGLGFVSVREGKLWQISLFRGLGELFLIPEYKKIIFNKAEGEFEIENQHIATDNLKLESPQLILDCAGKMSFEGKLDFTVYSAANKKYIRDSVDIRKFLAAIVGELSGAVAIKLGGTLKDPKFRMVPMPIDLIKNIKNFILGK